MSESTISEAERKVLLDLVNGILPGGSSAGFEACGRVIGGSGVASFIRGATIARTATGIYLLTLDTPLNFANMVFTGMPESNARVMTVSNTNDTNKQIRIVNLSGTDTDTNFNFGVSRCV